MWKNIRIPDTELELYPVGLGTVDMGLKADGAAAARIFDTYYDLGGNVLDSAHVYSDWIPGEKARAERVLGDWLKESGKRNNVVVMTKGGHPDMTVPEPDMHKSRLTHADMVQDLDESLMTLRTDWIDIYFYHRDDESQGVEEEIETMEEFVKQGKIRYYACSNWSAGRMAEADAYCAQKGYRGFVADQSLLNLGMKYMNPLDDDTLGYIRGGVHEYHVLNLRNLAMPYMGNASGFFHQYAAKGADGVKDSAYATPLGLELAEKVQKLARDRGISITQVVIGFFRFQDFPCLPLYSASKPERVTDVCGTLDAPLELQDYIKLLGQ